MTTAALITKLKKKLDKETDKRTLKTIEILLREDTKGDRIKRRMTEKAILSDEAIANGETRPWSEVREKLLKMKHSRSEKLKRQKRA